MPDPAREAAPTRVIHTMPDLIVGGGQHLLLRNIKGMDPRRVQSIVCCTCALGPMEAAYREAGFQLECLNWTSHAGVVGAARRLAAIIRQNHVDIIHTNNTVPDRTVGQLAAYLTGRPVVNSLHSEHERSDSMKGLKTIPRRFARSLGIRLSRATVDHVIPVSQSVRESWEPYLRAMGIGPDRITVINPGLAPERFTRLSEPDRAALRKSLNLDGAWPVLINIGRLNYHKGQHWLVPMMRQVVAKHPSARLLLVGDGQDRELLTNSIRANELHSVVSMLGQRSDITPLLNVADLFVFPSLTEGFPLAVLEAMAAALPIVAFNLPSFRGVVDDGNSAALVTLGNADELTRTVMQVLDDPARLNSMGRSALSVAHRFTQEATSGAITRIYESLAPTTHAARHPSASST
jgi:glycosyltransferase involved in cell wall biosynthesis